jgi:hydroxymethylglutaryl-CoA lyase
VTAAQPTSPSARDVTVVEVGPRDGLQNEPTALPAEARIAFVRGLAASGLTRIEAGAFVHPARVPQMASSDEVCRVLTSDVQLVAAGVRISALVPNLKGLERAMAAGVQEIAVFAAASETFSQRNLNQSIAEALQTYGDVCATARARGLLVRAYVSTAFGCPYEGAVSVGAVQQVTDALLAMGAYEVAVSDTIGVAHPGQVRTVLRALRSAVAADRLALHFHDTRGTALANVLAGLDHGVTTFDSSAGGLGGCPFAPGAAGNLATEDLLFMLNGLGIETGISIDEVANASRFIATKLEHALPSRYLHAPKLKL